MIGLRAEVVAAAELGRRGYRIVESNYRQRCGEIDLIAEHGDTLVFVEVRCKRTASYGSPAESITISKQRKIIVTAQHYVQEHNKWDTNCRFDVVEVVAREGKLVVLEVIENAFSA